VPAFPRRKPEQLRGVKSFAGEVLFHPAR
jgi:hypothetical protein